MRTFRKISQKLMQKVYNKNNAKISREKIMRKFHEKNNSEISRIDNAIIKFSSSNLY